MPQTIEYIGPRVTPLVLFAAMAPECPHHFTWSNPEPEPRSPRYSELSDELKQIDRDDPEGDNWPPELAAFYAQRKAATEAHDEWKKRDEYGRQVAWRWFYASLMVHAIPAPELAPQPLTTSPLIHGAFEAFAIERARQMHEKGYWPEHDDTHTEGELAAAAAWYAIPHNKVSKLGAVVGALWPTDWTLPEGDDVVDPTPAQRKRVLEKAGALLAAEWERLDRLEKAG